MPTALVGSLIGGATSLIGGSMQSDATDKAVKAQQQATAQSLAQQQRQYDQTRQDALASQATIRSDTQPYYTVGTNALNALATQYGLAGTPGTVAAPTYNASQTAQLPSTAAPDVSLAAFRADPGYQFTLDNAVRAATGSGLARGLAGSGALYNSVLGTAGGLASQEYNNFYNRQTQTGLNAYNEGAQNAQIGFNQATTNAQNMYNAQNNAFQQNFNMLTGLAGYGQNANTTNANVATGTQQLIAQAGLANANNQSNLTTAQGNATAAGLAANGQIGASTIGQIGGLAANIYGQLNPFLPNIGANVLSPVPVNTSPYGSVTPYAGIGGLSQLPSTPSLYGAG